MKHFFLKLVFWPERLVPWAKRTGLAHFPIVRALIDVLLLPADWRIVSSTVLKQTGHRPNWFRRPGFSEWITRSKLTNRHRIHAIWADKLAVRDWLENHGYGNYLTKLLWRGFDLNEARLLDLPKHFVIKANHTSGSVIVVKDSSTLDWAAAIAESKKWLATDYAASSAEWQYRWIKPELFIEEYLEQPNGTLLDYKVFTFHGKSRMIRVIDRPRSHRECCFDTNWKNLGWKITYPLLSESVARPKSLEEMILLSDRISSGTLHLRVDFYDISGRLVFGEITLHEGGTTRHTISPACEQQLTAWLWETRKMNSRTVSQ